MAILVLPATERRIMNAVSVAPGTSSPWAEVLLSTPSQNITAWLDCDADKGQLITEVSLDGSKWLQLNSQPPNYVPLYSPLDFGSFHGLPNGTMMTVNFTPLKRLRYRIDIDSSDTATRTANLWIMYV